MNSVYELPKPSPPPWNNLSRLSIGYSCLKNKFGHDIEDCIEMVLKQLISSFGTALTLFNKITNIDDAILAENKNRTVYIIISKTKVQIFLSLTSVMGIVLSREI